MISTKRILLLCCAFFAVMLLTTAVSAQLPRPPADPRMDDIRKLQDNNHMIDQQQRDSAAMRSKEERMGVVNEAFKRLQILHNELLTILSANTNVEATKIVEIANEVKLRASELNANLALPQIPKEKSKDKEKADRASTEPEAAP